LTVVTHVPPEHVWYVQLLSRSQSVQLQRRQAVHVVAPQEFPSVVCVHDVSVSVVLVAPQAPAVQSMSVRVRVCEPEVAHSVG
jgi:hypothetical protein